MKACLFTNQMLCTENYSTISMYYQQNEKSTGINENLCLMEVMAMGKDSL